MRYSCKLKHFFFQWRNKILVATVVARWLITQDNRCANGQNTSITNLDAANENSWISQINMLIGPLKNVRHPVTSRCCLCWNVSTYKLDAFCSVTGAHYVIKVMNLWYWQRRFVSLHTHNRHTQYVCNRALYCIRILTYMHICTCTRSRWTYCVHGPGYWPDGR
jgi:hypothetical protein